MIELTKEQIDSIFDTCTNQGDVLLSFYRYAYPDWDNIASIHNWPSVSDITAEYIFERAIAFDKKNHPNVIAGGFWLNSGFSSVKDMPNWMIDLTTASVEYKSS